jgi:uncharacterized protein (UPF0333 family)
MNVKFFSEQRGQISVELIIVLAAVIAVVLVLVSQLQQTSEAGAKSVDEASEKVFNKISEIK